MSKDFWKKIKKPIIALAPMDGYTDSAFRRVCKIVNPNIIVFTEFTSADGLHHGAKKLQEKFRYDHSEHPIIAQIFGKNIETFVTAAKYCEQQGFDGIDINMGCPSKKVVKSEHGVALRKKPELAFKLVEAVAQVTSLPLSVKTRLGWSNAEDLITFGQGLENAGANLITVHGRTYSEPYGVPAHFEAIYELKKNVAIPVIGNGGITSVADGKSKLGNLDGLMIGQASFGNPWVFSESPAPSFAEKIPIIKKHSELLFELKGDKIAMLEIRKHLLHYVKGLPNASLYRSQLVQVKSLAEIYAALQSIKDNLI
jgi:nifR3 family TIM-barrel protein